MPSEKVLQSKKELIANLSEKLKSSVAGVVVDYKGINVEDDTKLRRELREQNVDYFVVKNTMLRFAINQTGLEDLGNVLEGTTAIAISKEDPVSPAKVISKYVKELNSTFAIKAGFVDGKVIPVDQVTSLAKLPSKEVLVAQVLGGLNAPISGLANVLSGNIRGLVVALNQIAQKQNA